MTQTHGMVWWSELMTGDPVAAVDYYKSVCGWSIDEMPMQDGGGTYYIGISHGKPMAGIMGMPPGEDGAAPYWLTYMAVDDVDAAVAATLAAGGSIKRDVFEMPGIGRIALVIDPTGAEVGLITPIVPEDMMDGGGDIGEIVENVPV